MPLMTRFTSHICSDSSWVFWHFLYIGPHTVLKLPKICYLLHLKCSFSPLIQSLTLENDTLSTTNVKTWFTSPWLMSDFWWVLSEICKFLHLAEILLPTKLFLNKKKYVQWKKNSIGTEIRTIYLKNKATFAQRKEKQIKKTFVCL